MGKKFYCKNCGSMVVECGPASQPGNYEGYCGKCRKKYTVTCPASPMGIE